MKVAKAKKSTHQKGKAIKAIRGKVLKTGRSQHDPNQEWEIAVSFLKISFEIISVRREKKTNGYRVQAVML